MKIFTKHCLVVFVACISTSVILHAQVGVGTTTPNASAVLDVTSTQKGFLPPRMTSQQRDSISTPATGLVVYCTNCGNSGELDIYSGGSWVTTTGGVASTGQSVYTLAIGDHYLGGIVAYILQPVDQQYVAGEVHGIVATLTDVGTTLSNAIVVTNISTDSISHPWAPSSTKAVTGASDTATGLGANNTSKIALAQGVGNYAAYICQQYTAYGTGAAGWYLPDQNEMKKLYVSRSTIGGFIGMQEEQANKWGLASGVTTLGTYWTSNATIIGGNESNSATYFNFQSGTSGSSSRTSSYYIRPVKRF
jgi:hypothetical protein